jgi:hypothetical protein
MKDTNEVSLYDINGQPVALRDAVRNVNSGKVFRVARVHEGLITFSNSNGSKPSKVWERFCKVSVFQNNFKFECAAW